MRVFVAGATGVIGTRLLALLLGAGHKVAGMTRTPDKALSLAALGPTAVVCNVYDATALCHAVVSFAPDVVIHQLTDLPDRADEIPDYAPRNNRIRTEGTRNLLTAAAAARARQFLAQSIAWTPPGSGAAVADHERLVLDAGGASCATASSTARAPTTRTAFPLPLGLTSTPLPSAPWRYSTRRPASCGSPRRTNGDTSPSPEAANDWDDRTGHGTRTTHTLATELAPISLSSALPHAAVGLRRANRTTRRAFDAECREAPACGPCATRTRCVGLPTAR